MTPEAGAVSEPQYVCGAIPDCTAPLLPYEPAAVPQWTCVCDTVPEPVTTQQTAYAAFAVTLVGTWVKYTPVSRLAVESDTRTVNGSTLPPEFGTRTYQRPLSGLLMTHCCVAPEPVWQQRVADAGGVHDWPR